MYRSIEPSRFTLPRLFLGLIGSVLLFGAASAQPLNDNCADADPLIPGTPFTCQGAATDGLDFSGVCDPGPLPDDQIFNDVWYCWVAPTSGPTRLESFSFTTGARIAVYDSCACPADNGDLLACAEPLAPFDPLSELLFDAVAGTSYLIRVGGTTPTETPEGFLTIDAFVPSPSNLLCDDSVAGEVLLTWDLPVGFTFDSIEIWLNGVVEATLPPTATDYLFTIPPTLPVPFSLSVAGIVPGGLSAIGCTVGSLYPDDCSSPGPVVLGSNYDFDTLGASTDGPVLSPNCDPSPSPDDQIYDDLWYCWSAPFDGNYEVELLAFADPVRVAIYESCSCPADPATVIDCDEVGGFGAPASIPFVASAGTDYSIRVGASSPGFLAFGTFSVRSGLPAVGSLACTETGGVVELTWTLPAGAAYDSIEVWLNGTLDQTLVGTSTSAISTVGSGPGFFDYAVRGVAASGQPSADVTCSVVVGGPDNDDCPNPTTLTAGTINFDTTLATDGPMPILMTCFSPVGISFALQDVWYRYVAPNSGTVTVSTCGSSFDTTLAVYEDVGLCPPDLFEELVCGLDECGFQSELEFDAVAGATYLIRIGGEIGSGAPFFGTGTVTLDDGSPIGELFRRGDSNADGAFDISDAIYTLGALFIVGSPEPSCADAADANDDGTFDISDAIFSLAALFTPGATPIPDPGSANCGIDPTGDAAACADYANCP